MLCVSSGPFIRLQVLLLGRDQGFFFSPVIASRIIFEARSCLDFLRSQTRITEQVLAGISS